MKKPKTSRSRVAANESSLCQFRFADGRTCRMLRQVDHPSLCVFHARAERQIIESDVLGSELAASITGQFMTATDINFVLGKLFKAIAQNRISPRNAGTLAFVGKLLLNSLHELKKEYEFKYDYEVWKEMEANAITLSDPRTTPTLPAIVNALPANPLPVDAAPSPNSPSPTRRTRPRKLRSRQKPQTPPPPETAPRETAATEAPSTEKPPVQTPPGETPPSQTAVQGACHPEQSARRLWPCRKGSQRNGAIEVEAIVEILQPPARQTAWPSDHFRRATRRRAAREG